MTQLWTWISSIEFATPWLAWVAVLAAPVAVGLLHLWDRWRRTAMMRRIGELSVVKNLMATQSLRRRLIKDGVAAGALVLLLLAAARPQIEGKRKIEVRGLDVVVAVDVSKSMLVDDVGPTERMTRKKLPTTRLERARELATLVIDGLPGDRIGPVVFAGAASHFPLTDDHEVAIRFIHDLGPADLPQGSNLGEVLRVSRCLLRPDLYDDLGCARIGRRGHGGDPLRGESLDPKPEPGAPVVESLVEKVERGKAIMIISDGGDPDEETLREVVNARELGIAVIFIGVGTEQGGIVYEVDPISGRRTTNPKKLPDGSNVISKREDAGMNALAEASGDPKRYVVASERGELDPRPVIDMLKAVNRGLATKKIKEMRDVYEPFLFAALMLLVIEVAISTRRRQRYPEAT
ncbi:MAG: VWA domain-containing protein [Deltaproteobacteria bacterium]|nr:VWA domain-containing protein [Deltaproteobacteria bacterium]